MTIDRLRHGLAMVFDDNLKTVKWKNYVDYTIIGFILLSTIEIFLLTYDPIATKYEGVLNAINIITTIFFTIEVSARIWCADLKDKKFRGFWGRVRYCFTFYGLIDVLSTYTFYLAWVFPLPYITLKILRVARLLRLFRYMKAFGILHKALQSKRDEMVVSLQFLFIITLILSFFLYFVEHQAQPNVYDNGWTSVVWAFAQYIGDPGGFADTPPVTFFGRLIASIIGILGIAIFAVPAGLVASGFDDAMDEDRQEKQLKENIDRVLHGMRWVNHSASKLKTVPTFRPIENLITRQFLTTDEIIGAAKESNEIQLYNLAKAYSAEDAVADRVVVVAAPHNRPYGYCIDRGSKVTIVATSGFDEPITNWVAYHIALMGGFNYIAKHIEIDIDNPISFFNIVGEGNEHLDMFLDDLKRMSSEKDSWVIPMAFCNGPKSRPHQIHMPYSRVKGDEGFDNEGNTVQDTATYQRMFDEMSQTLSDLYGLKCDKNIYYPITTNNLCYHLPCQNSFMFRAECYTLYFAENRLNTIRTISEVLKRNLEPNAEFVLPKELKERKNGRYGYNGYNDYEYVADE